MQVHFCKISEALEDDAVIKFLCVPDQQVTISSLSFEIRAQAISYMVDATAHLGRVGDRLATPAGRT